MSLLIAMSSWDPDEWRARFSRGAPHRDIRVWPQAGAPEEVRYAAVWRPPEGVLGRFPNLEAIFNLGAGVDALLADPTLPDVPVVRVVDPDLTQRMTEYVALHALIHLRRQREYDAQAREGVWRDLDQPVAHRVTAGVMGLGALGRACAERLGQLGFDVAGWARGEKRIDGLATYAGQAGLGPFLARTDFLVCLLPLTPDTRGVLNRALFAGLRRDGPLGRPAVLNAGRGGLQVEADILAALDEGVLGHATLDVFETEPLPPEHPFWRHPGVTVTPHVAADSDPEAVSAYVLRQIEAHERGQPLANVIDRRTGY